MSFMEKLVGKMMKKYPLLRVAYKTRLDSERSLQEKMKKSGFDNAEDFIQHLESKAK